MLDQLDQTKFETMRADIEKVTLFSEAIIEFSQNISNWVLASEITEDNLRISVIADP